MKFEISARAMSLNSAYPANKQGRRFLCEKGKEYKKLISWATKKAVKEFSYLPDSKFYKLNLTFQFTDFFTKDKRVNKKRPDTSNCIKLIEDAICEVIGINDNIIIKHEIETIRDNHEKDSILVEIIKL